MDMCIPGNDALSQAEYEEIVSDPIKVDQIVSILIRYNKLDPKITENLLFVIPRIDAWDFCRYRDGKVELRHLRSKVLGLPKDWLVSLEDINQRVAEYEREIAWKKTLVLKDPSKPTTFVPPPSTVQKSHSKTQNLQPYCVESGTF